MLATEQRKPLITEELKKELNEKLRQEAINLELVDATIKVYPTAFIVFTVLRPRTNPQEFIKRMLNVADALPIAWAKEYEFNSIADVGTKFIEDVCLWLIKENKENNDKNERLTKFTKEDRVA